jgi:predicted aspartyl protease
MAALVAKLKIWNPADPERAVEIQLVVNAGTSHSWILGSQFEALGIRPTGKWQLRTLHGRLVEREVAPVMISVEGRTAGDTVVVAEAGDPEALGAHTLAALNLVVDPAQKKLVDGGPALALGASAAEAA